MLFKYQKNRSAFSDAQKNATSLLADVFTDEGSAVMVTTEEWLGFEHNCWYIAIAIKEQTQSFHEVWSYSLSCGWQFTQNAARITITLATNIWTGVIFAFMHDAMMKPGFCSSYVPFVDTPIGFLCRLITGRALVYKAFSHSRRCYRDYFRRCCCF